jgi:hypothetical protein
VGIASLTHVFATTLAKEQCTESNAHARARVEARIAASFYRSAQVTISGKQESIGANNFDSRSHPSRRTSNLPLNLATEQKIQKSIFSNHVSF